MTHKEKILQYLNYKNIKPQLGFVGLVNFLMAF